MELKFDCKNCNSEILVKYLVPGQATLCKACNQNMTIPPFNECKEVIKSNTKNKKNINTQENIIGKNQQNKSNSSNYTIILFIAGLIIGYIRFIYYPNKDNHSNNSTNNTSSIQYGCSKSGARNFAKKRLNISFDRLIDLNCKSSGSNNYICEGHGFTRGMHLYSTLYISCNNGNYSIINISTN